MNTTYNLLKPVHTEKRMNQLEAELLSHVEILNRLAMVSISNADGIIVHGNEQFFKTSGYTAGELLGLPQSVLRHPDTDDSVFEDLWATIKAGKVWEGEMKQKAKDGSAYWVIAVVAPVMDEAGKPEKFISVRYDITAQKTNEEELRQAKRKIDMELFESIEYAKQIHASFLNTKEDVKTICDDSFLIYKAQKMISGDFYKFEKRGDRLVFVVGDSTGHGVSASYISILVLNVISRAIAIAAHDPASLLKLANEWLGEATHSNGQRRLRESSDAIACCIDRKKMELTYASAKMRGFILRNGEIIHLEKDKCSIGEVFTSGFTVSNRTIQLKRGDCLYVFSDGLTDQFGGPQDKRIGIKRITSLIKEVSKYSMNTQHEIIERALADWQGDNEQTDDITLLGIRI